MKNAIDGTRRPQILKMYNYITAAEKRRLVESHSKSDGYNSIFWQYCKFTKNAGQMYHFILTFSVVNILTFNITVSFSGK